MQTNQNLLNVKRSIHQQECTISQPRLKETINELVGIYGSNMGQYERLKLTNTDKTLNSSTGTRDS